MQPISKLTMFQMAVGDMPEAKNFYIEKLGLKVTKDYRQDDNNWWVSLSTPEGNTSITLTTHHGHMKAGALTLYFTASDIDASHAELAKRNVEVSEIQNDLYGPGSAVKWFNFNDPDGNLIHVAQV